MSGTFANYPASSSGGGGSSDHHTLTNLTTFDDHTQYLYLAGRSGGQVAFGGSAASQTLTLGSTANATKGKIIFGTSAYDEANNRLGIGFASPVSALQIDKGTATASYLQFTAGATTGQASTDGFHVGIDTTGLAQINQKENLVLQIMNNNLETMRFSGDNRAWMGNDFFGSSIFSTSVNRDLAGSIGIENAIVPEISDSTGGATYYGLLIQPSFSGAKSSSLNGAYFSITCDQAGVGGELAGVRLNCSNQGEAMSAVYGGIFSCEGTATDLIASGYFFEPNTGVTSSISQGLVVSGTWGADEFSDPSSGTLNAFEFPTSFVSFSNAVTLNGIVGGRGGKRLLITFGAGATITNNSASAAAGNKILVSTGANITILGSGSVELVYSGSLTAWIVISSQL